MREMINTEAWSWECVGIHRGPALLGPWDACAYVAEGPRGWYASAEGQKQGLDYTYRLPGRKTASGPYPHEDAVRIARQMIGLAPDAEEPTCNGLLLFRPPIATARAAPVVKDVTGQVWAPFTSRQAVTCTVCGAVITQGWSQGRWSAASYYLCDAHVEVQDARRPADQ